MTPADFRRIALSLEGAQEGSHMAAADFRVGGRIFATLASQHQGYGNLMLTPAQQAEFVDELPDVFVPIKGGWGRMGMTHIRLAKADEDILAGALHAAWKVRLEKREGRQDQTGERQQGAREALIANRQAAPRRTIELQKDKILELEALKDTPPWDWPHDTGEAIQRILRDRKRSASDRIQAAGLAGDLAVMDDEMAQLLLAILQNATEPEDLRSRVAISLGPALDEVDTYGFDDDVIETPISEPVFEEARKTLRMVHEDPAAPKLVRRRALEAAVRAPEDWQEAAVRSAYSIDDQDWKLTAIFCMRWIDGFEPEILKMLDSENPEIHLEAVLAAGHNEMEKAWPHISRLRAGSPKTEKGLRLAAIDAAPSVNAAEAQHLLAALTDSEDDDIATAASDALTTAEDMGEPEDEDDEDEEDDDNPYF